MQRIILLVMVFLMMVGCSSKETGQSPAPDSSATGVIQAEQATGLTTSPTATMTAGISTSTPTPAPQTAASQTAIPEALPPLCDLPALVVPTLPAVIPGYTQLDESIGLHVTGHYQVVDVQSYRLKISGLVATPLELSYDELRCMPRTTVNALLICYGVFEDEADWTGVSLRHVLDQAGGMLPGAEKIVLISADGYRTSVGWKEGLINRNLLAYEVNDEVLPILHGFPLRAVILSEFGEKWVKWLVEIRVE